MKKPKRISRKEFYRLARKFARGRVTVDGSYCAPPEQGFKQVFRPRVAGAFVRPEGMPKHGYMSREEAVAGGKRFRQECRDVADDPGAYNRIGAKRGR